MDRLLAAKSIDMDAVVAEFKTTRKRASTAKKPVSVEVWAIRVWLQLEHRTRELALFDLGLDSKPRSCDLVKLRVRDVCYCERVAPRATVMRQKTSLPVQFELTEATRSAVAGGMKLQNLHSEDYSFPSRIHNSPHLGTRQYARIVQGWVKHVGLDPCAYGTHSIQRTKVTLIYKRTKNLCAVQLLLGHAKLESTIRYLGIEVDDAHKVSEETNIWRAQWSRPAGDMFVLIAQYTV